MNNVNSEQFNANIRQQAEAALRAAGIPGISIAFRQADGPIARVLVGEDASGRPLEVDSLFPVASITKLATALVVLQLVDRGEITLDAPLSTFLPDARAARPGVTVRRLLSHSTGLPYDVDMAWVRSATTVDWSGFARACLYTELAEPPGSRVQYSNVGYGLLALVVERVRQASFRSVLTESVLKPLGIEGYLGDEPPRSPMQLKDIRGESLGTRFEPFNTPSWRSLGLPWGGLVTTIDGVLALVRAYRAHRQSLLSPTLLTAATSNQNGELAGGFVPPFVWSRCWWGLGPDLHDRKNPHWAPATSSRETYGHSGAAGALVYLDPRVDVAWAIIGTRTADNGWLVRWGPRIGSAIVEACSEGEPNQTSRRVDG